MNFNLLAEGGGAPAAGAGMSSIMLIAYIAIIGGALYFFMIRPQRKRQKKEDKMRNSIEMGDEIVTIGGIHGKVVALKEDALIIESQLDHSKLKIAKWAVQTNLTVHEDK